VTFGSLQLLFLLLLSRLFYLHLRHERQVSDMSLNYDLTKIENSDELFENDRMNAVTESLIFYTIFIGMNQITNDNSAKFFERVYLYEKLFGASVSFIDEDNNRVERKIKYADIRRHLGLHTNATSLSDTAFKNNMVKRAFEDARSFIRISGAP
jgi:hypothetical protein